MSSSPSPTSKSSRKEVKACMQRRKSFLETTVEDEPDEPFEQQRHVKKDSSATQNTMTYGHFMSTLSAGVGSGVLSSIICAPLDLVRTRMQVWGDVTSTGSDGKPKRVTAPQVLRDIYRSEGFQGCFRGLGATLVTVPFFWGVYFPLYDATKQYIEVNYADVAREHTSLVHCGAAVTTGAVADIIVNPLFVLRTRLQTQALHAQLEGSSANRLSMREGAQQLYQQGGIRMFYRGMTANFMGLSHVAVQFPVYERLKKIARQRRRKLIRQENELEFDNSSETLFDALDEDENHNNGQSRGQDDILTAFDLLLTSGCAKMCASLLTYPHEVLRSRMMDSRATATPTLTGTFRSIVATEGFAGLYTGLPVTLLRVVPNCCVTFVSYEYLLRFSRGFFIGDESSQ